MSIFVGGIERSYANGTSQDQLFMACSVQLDNGGVEAQAANARLIAAAPELLQFAEWLLTAYHSDEGMPEAKDIAKEARLLIAKATGETS